jgi:hypothetical protein
VCCRARVQAREVELWRLDHRACAQGDQHDEHHQQSGPDETGLWRNASLKVFIDDKSQVPAGIDMRSNTLSHGFVQRASLVPVATEVFSRNFPGRSRNRPFGQRDYIPALSIFCVYPRRRQAPRLQPWGYQPLQ